MCDCLAKLHPQNAAVYASAFGKRHDLCRGPAGAPRLTNDVDSLTEITAEYLDRFLRDLPNTFYVDTEEALRSVAAGRPFNVIHVPTVLKFDFFPSGAFPTGSEELDRAISLAD